MKTSSLSTLLRAGQKTLATEKGKQWTRLCAGLVLASFLSWALSKTAPAMIGPDYLGLQLKVLLLAASAAALLITFPRQRHALVGRWRKQAQQAVALETPQRLYLRVVQITLGLLLLDWLNPGPMLAPLGIALGAFCIYVAFYDAQRLYKSFSGNVYGKGALAIGFASSSALAYALARQEIAGATHVVPANFQHTTILLSIMTIPFLLVLAGGALFAICMAAYSIVVPLHMFARKMAPGMMDWLFAGTLKASNMKFPLVTRLFQLFFYATLGTLVSHHGRPAMASYEAALQAFAPAAVYHLDMYEGRECPLLEGEKLAALGDSKFLIGKRDKMGNIGFTGPIKCDDLPTRPAIP